MYLKTEVWLSSVAFQPAALRVSAQSLNKSLLRLPYAGPEVGLPSLAPFAAPGMLLAIRLTEFYLPNYR